MRVTDDPLLKALEEIRDSTYRNAMQLRYMASRAIEAAALSHAAGQEVVACYGLRRKGETGVIGLIPEKVHKVKPTSEEFLRDYEEVPLYFHPAVARSEGEG